MSGYQEARHHRDTSGRFTGEAAHGGAITGGLYGAATGALGRSRGRRGRAAYLGAGIGAATGYLAGVGLHAKTSDEFGHGLSTTTVRSITPLSVTRTKGIPIPVPNLAMETDAWKNGEHVGYLDSQRTLLRPGDNHAVNVYVDKPHRGKGVAGAMAEANRRSGGKTHSSSGHRSVLGNKLATSQGAESVETGHDDMITRNLDAAWEGMRRKPVRKSLSSDVENLFRAARGEV